MVEEYFVLIIVLCNIKYCTILSLTGDLKHTATLIKHTALNNSSNCLPPLWSQIL